MSHRRRFVNYEGTGVNWIEVRREVGLDAQGLVLWEAVCTYEGCGRVLTLSSQASHRGQESCGCKARKERQGRAPGESTSELHVQRPALVQNKIHLSEETMRVWKSAVWTVKEGARSS